MEPPRRIACCHRGACPASWAGSCMRTVVRTWLARAWQWPCRCAWRGSRQVARKGSCRGALASPARPLPGPHQPSSYRHSCAATDPTSWAGTCVAACNPSWRLHHRATSAACLPTWHCMHRWPGSMSKREGATMDGTGLAPVPNKAKGHLILALNASCPVTPAISSQRCSTFHLLCATVAAPFAYKRRPMAHRERIRLF